MAAALASLTLLALLMSNCICQCPISGCDGLRSFSSLGSSSCSFSSYKSAVVPKLLWSYEQHRPSGAGCATDGSGDVAVVICPMADGENVSVVSFAASNGTILWTLSLASQAVLPLINYNGQSVVSDGYTLDWLARDGRSLSPPVQMYPVRGSLFDLTITRSTSIVTMLYKCGFIATYTVDGVPISGLWLNGTREGVKGTYIPLGNSVMNDTRLYIITAFREQTADDERTYTSKNQTSRLRLYAINVAESLDRKFTILWTHGVTIEGLIPYIHTQETYCNNLPIGKTHSYLYKKNIGSKVHPETSSDSPPPSVLTMNEGRLLASVHIESVSGTHSAFNMSVRDLGVDYSVLSSGYSENVITSFSWSNTDKDDIQSKIISPSVRNEGGKFWVSFTLPGGNKTVLKQLTELSGPTFSKSSLTLPTTRTTPVTLLEYQSSTNNVASGVEMMDMLVFGTSNNVSIEEPTMHDYLGGSKQPHLVGVVVGGASGEREGEERKRGGVTPVVVWSVPLPHSQPAQGQISTIPLSSHSLLFITTPLGVYAYTQQNE